MIDECISNVEHEKLNAALADPIVFAHEREKYTKYTIGLVPRILGGFLIWCGNILYGEAPSYLKFRAIEVVARVPYHSWESVVYTLLTIFYTDERRAVDLAKISHFARTAQDNETMHVIVITQIARAEGNDGYGIFRHTIIPMLFSFFYFWVVYLLSFIAPRYAFELNYLFEDHAFEQYDRFLATQGDLLKNRQVSSIFLERYGRSHKHQYDFFLSVRNDELIHRNLSIERAMAASPCTLFSRRKK